MSGEMLQIGSVTKSAGAVSVRRADGTTGELSVGAPVHQGDQVQTGADGAVGITLSDKSAFSLGPKGSLQLDELVYDPANPGEGHSTVAALQGAFTAVSGDIAKAAPGAMFIKTPVMIIGVRGTTIAGTAAAEGSQNTVTLLRDGDGTVGQVSISNAGGTQVLTGESHSLQLSSFIQPPPPPVALSAAQIQQLYGSALSAQPLPPTPPPANPLPPAPPTPQGTPGDTAAPTTDGPVTADPNAPGFINPAGLIADAVEQDKERAIEQEMGILFRMEQLNGFISGDIAALDVQFDQLLQDLALTEQEFLDFLASLDDMQDFFDDFPEDFFKINVIRGTSAGEVINGTDGNDLIYPEPGVDTVYAGAGNDTVEAEGDEVGDTFYGGVGIDTISYAAAAHGHLIDLSGQTATSGMGLDYIYEFEIAVGSMHDDTLKGSSGDDMMLFGNGGNDTFIETDGMDFIDGGAGDHDLIKFSEAINGVEINLGHGFVVNDGWGNGGSVMGVEDVKGSSHNDIITGDGNDNVLEGWGGDDTLNGGGGNDTFIEGAGTDVMDGGAGAHDLISFANATSAVDINLHTGVIAADGFGGTGTVSGVEDVTGGTNADTITGDNNANVLDGGQGDDTLSGGQGNDTLIGGMGLDQLTGGDGNDVFKFMGSNQGLDTITDYRAGDRIWLSADDFGLTSGATNFLYAISYWGDPSLGGLSGAGIIAVTNGSDVELWYNSDLGNAPDSSNSYQIATLQTANVADVSVIAG